MITKRTNAGFWQNERPVSHLLDIGSKGAEKGQLQKIAAAVEFDLTSIKPESGHSFVHIVTTGAGESYGSNANSDFYNEGSRTWIFPEAKAGIQKSAQLDGGLRKYHRTYREYGGVYREHKNSTTGFEKLGTIILETYNEQMHRGELVVKLKDDLWRNELEKIASGQPIAWSQGSSVKEDICSLCGNRASTRAGYCDCLKYNKLGISKEGHMVFAINDAPYFHDISCVGVPADKIAYTLSKVASANPQHLGAFLQEKLAGLYVPVAVMNKIANRREADRYRLLQKLAEIEKKVEAKADGITKDLSEAFEMMPEDEDEIVNKLSDIPLDKLFSSLSGNNSMLSPNCFIRIVLKKKPREVEGVSGLPKALAKVFSDILQDGDFEDVLEDGSFLSDSGKSDRSADSKVHGLSDLLSLDPEPVQRRIIRITIVAPSKKKGNEKEASLDEPSKAAKYLAREYAKYQLSFLANTKREDNLLLAVLQNRV